MTSVCKFSIPSTNRQTSYCISLPSSDIDKCISFNAVRIVLSVFSLALAVSDIPRSGTGIEKLDGWLKQVAPDTALYFGPFTYHTAQILRLPLIKNSTKSAEYQGFLNDVAIESTPLWPYKFDSMSVPQRALAKELSVSAYPPCVLYKEKCPSNQLSLKTTFEMIDGLIEAVQHAYFPDVRIGEIILPIGYRTISYWVDRLHHYVLAIVGSKRSEARLHAVYFYRIAHNQTLNVCDRNVRKAHRPLFCGIPIKWTCPAFTGEDVKWSSTDRIPLALHLMVRLAQLQRRHPHLHFDVTVFTSQIVSSNNDQRLPVATSLLLVKKNGVTALIRGRTCQHGDQDCKTVLVDDHRYEREILKTDVTGWYWIASLARGMSQSYVWARIVFLWYGSYCARASESKHQKSSFLRRVWCAWTTFFKIPSHTIIYGSWMPALGYAFAYGIDCNIHHQHIDEVFASMNGVYTFDFWGFLRVSCVQMRNIWFIVICFKGLTLVKVYGSSHWKLRDGLIRFNGQLVGWLSALTIFAPMRMLAFRTTDVISFEMVPVSVILKQNSFSTMSDSIVEFGFRLDVKSIAESCVLTLIGVIIMKLFVWGFHPRRTAATSSAKSVIYRTRYLPYSVGTLTSYTSLSFYWRMSSKEPNRNFTSFGKLASLVSWGSRSKGVVVDVVGTKDAVACSDLTSEASSIQSFTYPPLEGSRLVDSRTSLSEQYQSTYQIERRSKVVWSMVRLVNLALFTDPITLFRIYFIGCSLYIYRKRSNSVDLGVHTTNSLDVSTKSTAQALFLLPCTLDQLLENALTGNEQDDQLYELVDTVDSSDVPWTLLLQCG